ncbi:hypothetical protein SDJN02_23247, partial [Cucurbita argyrosperma subsp. argyrosperma]
LLNQISHRTNREETKNNNHINNRGSLQRQRQLLDDSILLSWLPSLFWV